MESSERSQWVNVGLCKNNRIVLPKKYVICILYIFFLLNINAIMFAFTNDNLIGNSGNPSTGPDHSFVKPLSVMQYSVLKLFFRIGWPIWIKRPIIFGPRIIGGLMCINGYICDIDHAHWPYLYASTHMLSIHVASSNILQLYTFININTRLYRMSLDIKNIVKQRNIINRIIIKLLFGHK